MKKVTALCAKLQAKPEELLHVLCMGTIDDHLADYDLVDSLQTEIAARFPAPTGG